MTAIPVSIAATMVSDSGFSCARTGPAAGKQTVPQHRAQHAGKEPERELNEYAPAEHGGHVTTEVDAIDRQSHESCAR